MPNQRSKRNKTQKFYCPFCQQRLWRAGGPKYHLFYQGKSEIKKALNITSKKASFLAAQNSAYIDCQVWLEEFFCKTDNQLWMRLTKSPEGKLMTQLATSEDWERSVRTPHPELPNPSVGEFTYRMSRRAGQQLARYGKAIQSDGNVTN